MSVFTFATVPIIGILVRYRVSYYPINAPANNLGITDIEAPSPALDNKIATTESDQHAPENLSLQRPTFWSVWKTVWMEEHFEGLFKGTIPGAILVNLYIRFYVSPAPVVPPQRTIGIPWVPLLNILYIPLLVLTYRMIVTPYRLRLSRPKEALRLMFSEYERKHPFRSYQHSGLIPLFLIGLLLQMLVIPLLTTQLGNVDWLFEVRTDDKWWQYLARPVFAEWLRLAARVVLVILATLVCTPLDVICTRLSVQPMYGPPGERLSSQRNAEKIEQSQVELTAASVKLYTVNQEPYQNALDCLRRTIKEEGLGTLYRGWWLTLFGVWVPLFR